MSLSNVAPAADEKQRRESIAFHKKTALEMRHNRVERPDLSEVSYDDMAQRLKRVETFIYDRFLMNAEKPDVGLATLEEIRELEAAVHATRHWLISWAAQEKDAGLKP